MGARELELIADRFVVKHDSNAIDLATGDRVELVFSAKGGVSDQTRWAEWCERFRRLHHRAIARLIDYGPIGESQRFEAWQADCEWRGSAHDSEIILSRVGEFLRVAGWTDGEPRRDRLRRFRGRVVFLPSLATGEDVTRAAPRSATKIAAAPNLGINEIPRLSVVAIAGAFAVNAQQASRAIALCGASGSGRDTATLALARSARLNGYVPIASHLVQPALAPLLQHRSVALFASCDHASAWQRLLYLSLLSRKPHIAVFVGARAPRAVVRLTLEPLGAEAMVCAVEPRWLHPHLSKRIAAAAKRAGGLPGRFAALAWGVSMDQPFDEIRRSRAAETALQYGRERGAPRSIGRTGEVVEWPEPGELAALRKRLRGATALDAQGRHTACDRVLRQVAASLARRHDWPHAVEALVALATSLVRRGRPREAQTMLAEAREAMLHVNDADIAARLAAVSGRALVDDGRLDEAEAVLTAALAAANALQNRAACCSAAVGLARCQFWQAQFDAARHTLARFDAQEATDDEAVRLLAMQSRIAAGLGDLEGAIVRAAEAVERARHTNQPGSLALAASAAAFAHLAVGDHAAVEGDVAVAVRAARQGHDPLRALRARLVGAESQRRQGRRASGLRLCRVVGRLKPGQLARIVGVRVNLLEALLAGDGVNEHELITRHAHDTGLPGLVVISAQHQSINRHSAAVADIVTILQCCQTAEEEAHLLDGLCARLRQRLQASGVAFFVEENGTFTAIASDGARPEPDLASRVAAVDQTITPHLLTGRLEAGAPVRYGDKRIGALLVRWALGSVCEPMDAAVLLATAATAAAPAVASMAAQRASARPRPSEILGASAAVASMRTAIERAASAPFPVLIEGESGSGKELIARALHRQSARRERSFCTLNCAALPDDLVESELFGHSRGAFTGAMADRPGVFEEAHAGTLFLDEIGELSARAQAKVLRTIQEGELRRVGENIPRRVDVRLVAATNRRLRDEVTAGRFRLDLLYRLDIIRIGVPPLRDRLDDIPQLAEHFWRDATARIGSRATLSQAAIAELARYDWPGNVRELQNVLASLAVRAPRRGVVPPSALPPHFGRGGGEPVSQLDAARKTFDRQFIRAALARTGGHRARAAQELGVTRQGLTKLIVRLGL